MSTKNPNSFDSSSFQRRQPLPSINFNGFVNEADTAPDADNFVEFAATPTTNRFTLRSRQRMILGTLKLEFDHTAL